LAVPGKLAAAKPRERIGIAADLTKATRDLSEQLVAGGMIQIGVDFAKPIEAHDEQGEWTLFAAGKGDQLLEAVDEEHTVGQLGQGVVKGLAGKDRAGVLAPPLIYLAFLVLGFALDYAWSFAVLAGAIQY
jgi:hypothetical protein